MARRDDLLSMLDMIEQHARTEQEGVDVGRIRNAHLMYDAADPEHPSEDDFLAVEAWIDRYKADVAGQMAQLSNVLIELGE